MRNCLLNVRDSDSFYINYNLQKGLMPIVESSLMNSYINIASSPNSISIDAYNYFENHKYCYMDLYVPKTFTFVQFTASCRFGAKCYFINGQSLFTVA